MGSGWVVPISIALFTLIIGGVPWCARRIRQRGISASPFTVFDEIWHPAAFEAHIQLEVHDERVSPAPEPGDPPVTDPQKRHLQLIHQGRQQGNVIIFDDEN